MILIGVALMSIALVTGSPTATMNNGYSVEVSGAYSKQAYNIGDLYNDGSYLLYTEVVFDNSTSLGSIHHLTSLKYDFQITNEPGFYLHQYYEFKPVFDSDGISLVGLKLDAYTDQYQSAQMVSNLYIPYVKLSLYYSNSDYDIDLYGINNLTNTYQSNTYSFDSFNLPSLEGDTIEFFELLFEVYSYDYATSQRFNSLVNGDVYNSGYNSGYDSGFNSGYSQGYHDGDVQGDVHGYSNGYTDGYTYGYDTGYDIGYSYGESFGDHNGYIRGLSEQNPYTFGHFFGAIADVPILYIRQLLGFDFFGISALTILMSMVTGVLVLFLLRRIVF